MLKIALLIVSWFTSISAMGLTQPERDLIYDNYLQSLSRLTEANAFQRQQRFESLILQANNDSVHHQLFTKAYSELLLTQPHRSEPLRLLNFDALPTLLHLSLVSTLPLQRDIYLELKVQADWKSESENFKRKVCAFSQSENAAIRAVFKNNNKALQFCLSHHTGIRPPSGEQLRDLVENTPDARDFRGGTFYKKPVLFQFCRTKRNYTCLQVMKDKDGRWVRKPNGTIWNQGVLSLSRYGNKFNQFNGDTPAGLYTLDGVMPAANKQYVYGRFRRLIMLFVPPSNNESVFKSLLPESHHDASWWKESVIARDMGRDLLRIHGTLRRNDDKNTSYYPFYPTLGCVATKEGLYDGTDYMEQRYLLDQLMTQQGLQPIYDNETRIRALFYVVEIDDRAAPVRLSDLREFGVE